MRTSWTLLLGLTLSALTLVQTAHADALADIKSRGLIKVAIPQDYPPFGSVGPDMKPLGLDIDMANLVATGLGVKIELVPVNSANRIPYLATGKVDLVVSTLGKTPDREKVVDFSDKYMPFFMGIFGPKDLEVSKPEDLIGKSIATTRGALEDLEVTKYLTANNIDPAKVSSTRFEDNVANATAYRVGKTQLIGTSNIAMGALEDEMKKSGSNVERVPTLKVKLKDSPCFMGFNKDEPALKDAVNKIIAKAGADGTLNKLSEKWLHEPLPSDFLK